ncbi:MAG: hypothetical protein EBX65_01630, partial [Betaproteobacteria bacterium]|nr:hypothetical protein [Betaproteobacteria bacterium]
MRRPQSLDGFGLTPILMQSSPSAKRAMLLLALASLLLGIVSMGATPLFDVDEGAFSEASREMLQS